MTTLNLAQLSVRRVVAPRAGASSFACSAESSRSDLLSWLPGPLEAAAFVPRLTVGAALSATEKLQQVQPRIQKLNELANNSALSAEEKQRKVLDVIEADVLEFLSKGADVEASLLTQVRTSLPADIASQIPVPARPLAAPISTSAGPVVTELPDGWDEDDSDAGPPPMPTSDGQASAALVELGTAVNEVQAALQDLADNKDSTRNTMLKLNLREACDRLSMRIAEVEGSRELSGVAVAVAEAKELLVETRAEL